MLPWLLSPSAPPCVGDLPQRLGERDLANRVPGQRLAGKSASRYENVTDTPAGHWSGFSGKRQMIGQQRQKSVGV